MDFQAIWLIAWNFEQWKGDWYYSLNAFAVGVTFDNKWINVTNIIATILSWGLNIEHKKQKRKTEFKCSLRCGTDISMETNKKPNVNLLLLLDNNNTVQCSQVFSPRMLFGQCKHAAIIITIPFILPINFWPLLVARRGVPLPSPWPVHMKPVKSIASTHANLNN